MWRGGVLTGVTKAWRNALYGSTTGTQSKLFALVDTSAYATSGRVYSLRRKSM